MSEGPPADTPDQAIRNYLNAIAWMAMLVGIEMIFRGDHVASALLAFCIGFGLFYAAYKWDWTKARLSLALVESLGRVATNARWWIALALVALLGVIFSPYIEQSRWPYTFIDEAQYCIAHCGTQPQEDIAKSNVSLTNELASTKKENSELRNANRSLKEAMLPPEQVRIAVIGARYLLLNSLLNEANQSRQNIERTMTAIDKHKEEIAKLNAPATYPHTAGEFSAPSANLTQEKNNLSAFIIQMKEISRKAYKDRNIYLDTPYPLEEVDKVIAVLRAWPEKG
jgi:hypothetical protein